METPLILIVEDDPLIAEDIADICRQQQLAVAGIAHRAGQALSLVEAARPNLILLDIHLGEGATGIDLARHLQARHAIPYIFITSYADQATLQEVQEVAPAGYIVKPFTPEQLISTLQITWSRLHRPPAPSVPLLEGLSSREQEILGCLRKGMSNAATAKALFISPNTVKFHLKNLYAKFDVNSRSELMARLLGQP